MSNVDLPPSSLLRRLALIVAVLASLWSFVPIPGGGGTMPSLTGLPYWARGINFLLDRQGRVEVIEVRSPRRAWEVVLPSQEAPRPGEKDVVGGVGCCGVRLGDTEEAVVQALGEPAMRSPFAPHTQLVYEHVWVRLREQKVSTVCTCRQGAATPEGVGIGSSREDVIKAYGPLEQDSKRAPDVPNGVATSGSVQMLSFGVAWHSRAAGVVFVALFVSLVICLLLRLVPRGPVWAMVVLACVGAWIAYPVARAVVSVRFHGFLWSVSDWVARGYYAFPDVRCTLLDPFVFSLKAWLRAPLPTVHALAALLGLFVAGRLALRWFRVSDAAAYLAALSGAVLLGTAVPALWVALMPARPRIVQVLRGPWTWQPLTAAALPSLALACCLLLVACQRKRWWETARLALGLDRPRGEPSGTKA